MAEGVVGCGRAEEEMLLENFYFSTRSFLLIFSPIFFSLKSI